MIHILKRVLKLLLTYCLLKVAHSQSNVDNRCFLEGGGSTLSFFVKESLPIGSIIGRLNIQGKLSLLFEHYKLGAIITNSTRHGCKSNLLLF